MDAAPRDCHRLAWPKVLDKEFGWRRPTSNARNGLPPRCGQFKRGKAQARESPATSPSETSKAARRRPQAGALVAFSAADFGDNFGS